MNSKVIWTVVAIIIILAAVIAGIYVWQCNGFCSSVSSTPAVGTGTSTIDMIEVDTPLPDVLVLSPLIVTGRARGNWYFEASFPVKIFDANGTLLGSVPAQAQGDWMTQDFVPFIATLSFSTSTTETGTAVLEKDNPSGLPQNDASVSVPVYFSNNAGKL